MCKKSDSSQVVHFTAEIGGDGNAVEFLLVRKAQERGPPLSLTPQSHEAASSSRTAEVPGGLGFELFRLQLIQLTSS